MDGRPMLKLDLTTTDKMIEPIDWVVLIGIWILTLSNYPTLPEIIPIHCNGAGEADGFGEKWNILTLPIVSSILFIGMTILDKYPHILNYPSTVTKKNALHQYTSAIQLIRSLKLIIVMIFGLIVFKTVQNVNVNADGLGVWFLPMILDLSLFP